MKPPKVIAEIGCNHKGDMKIAKEMISIAKAFCQADFVKFQKRNNKELLPADQYNAPHPVPSNSYGDTYGAHREYLEFSVDQHKELMEYCDETGIGYSTSVWDVTSAREMASLQPEFLKVPSASNLHFEMLGVLCDEFEGKIQLSLGMTTQKEEEEIVQFFEKKGRNKDLLLYACTSGYPVPAEQSALLEITRLKQKFDDRVEAIGFSGHHLGIALDIAAYTLGAEWIERHYTLDRTWKGTDHAASLEPDGLRKLVRDLHVVADGLNYKSEELLPIEIETRRKLKWTATESV
ncbi:MULTISPECIES: N-acetylneuraminate synthase family protein [Henriciella]|jgi:sialic acid synthase|uniref:N-acetylneuraminate synthase n=1 Tax=Henriciella pelagia TaxID=1977912 RepID=A0ABQ1JUQ7_9PROT|nr:N-acetylneuraminate synthase family protein [Henriciella pelagia]GGB75394.1 N-acetylneuraminate synthase [Henriciella pelagia]